MSLNPHTDLTDFFFKYTQLFVACLVDLKACRFLNIVCIYTIFRCISSGEKHGCVFVENNLAESETKLCASTKEQREAREELETCRTEIQILQGALATERMRAEAVISRSLTDRDELQQSEVRAVSLTFCLKVISNNIFYKNP